jgi:hypothetical protein
MHIIRMDGLIHRWEESVLNFDITDLSSAQVDKDRLAPVINKDDESITERFNYNVITFGPAIRPGFNF